MTDQPLPGERRALTLRGLRLPSVVVSQRALATLAFVFGVCLALVLLQLARTDTLTRDNPLFAEPGWDHHAYIAMASDGPFDFHLAPFGWRVLVPSLASILPFGIQANFLVLAIAGLAATAAALYYLARAAGYAPGLAALAPLLFVSLPWAVKFPLQDFYLPDAIAFFMTVLALIFAVRRQPFAFAAVLAIGVLAKESVLFTAPLYYTLTTPRWWAPRWLLETAACAAPAVVVLLVVRLAIPARNDDLVYVATLPERLQEFRSFIPSYNYVDLLRDIGWHQRLHDHRSDTLLAYSTGTWGVGLLALAAMGAAVRPLLALRLLPFLVLVYSQLLFAVNIERLLVLGFPAMIWLALEAVRFLATRVAIRAEAFLLLPAFLILLNLRHPSVIPVGFEVQTLVFLGYLALVLPLAPRVPLLRAPGGAPRSPGLP